MRNALSLIFMVRSNRQSWVPAVAWILAAVVSVSTAVWVAMQPGRLADLHLVRVWLAYFATHSTNPYAHFFLELDYPPIALLILYPLNWIPEATLAPWFVSINLVVTIVAGWVLVRAISERLEVRITLSHRVALVGLLVAGSGLRSAIWMGNTAALSILFGALALLWSRRRPRLAILVLALCAFKPHVAFGFGLAILLIDGALVPLVAAALAIAVSLAVAATFDESLLSVVTAYVHNLFRLYGWRDHVEGLLSVRWVLEDIVVHYGFASALYAVFATASLVAIVRVARGVEDAAGRTQVMAAALLWPVVFLPSQLYNSMMASPALWLMMWPEGRVVIRESRRLAGVAAFVLFGFLDISRVLRLASEWIEDGQWLYRGSFYLKPLQMLVLFGLILTVLVVTDRRKRIKPAA